MLIKIPKIKMKFQRLDGTLKNNITYKIQKSKRKTIV